MTGTFQFLRELEKRGIAISLAECGRKITYCAPKGAVTPEARAEIASRLAEIVEALSPRPASPVSSLAASQPTTWSAPTPRTFPPGTCDRCGSVKSVDVSIHDGISVRRDCAKCGRFMAFPVWYGESFPVIAAAA